MKKMSIIFVTIILGIGIIASAGATIIEEYTGIQRFRELSPYSSFDFGFDLQYLNSVRGVSTNSSLTLTTDGIGAFGEWISGNLYITFRDMDTESEQATIDLTAWNNLGGTLQSFSLGTISFNVWEGMPNFTYTHNFTQAQLDAFEAWGWGNIHITATPSGITSWYNDGKITTVGMTIAVPEPNFLLLIGVSLIGLGLWGRKKFKRN